MNKLYLYFIIYFQVLQSFLVIHTYHSKLYLQITVYNLSDEDLEDEVTYQLWDSTDRTSMSTMVSTLGEFIDLLVKKIDALTSHSFTAKSQAAYLKERKTQLTSESAIIIMDFAENYEYVIQDEVQSYHWSKERCTLHPVSLYTKNGEILEHKSFCIMSDDLQHDTCFVYEVLKLITEYCRSNLPDIVEIQYFSDGCAGQYKNYKNFINLCLHKVELGLDATWNFFATSHGKGPCDGIGGSVKRLARLESLRRVAGKYLNTFDKLYEFCASDINNVAFMKITAAHMEMRRPAISARWQGGSTVPGTQSFHQFHPLNHETIAFKRLSSDVILCGKRKFSTPVPPM